MTIMTECIHCGSGETYVTHGYGEAGFTGGRMLVTQQLEKRLLRRRREPCLFPCAAYVCHPCLVSTGFFGYQPEPADDEDDP